MAQQMGRQSLQFENPPWIISSGCIAGTKEGEGPIGHEIDLIGEDDNFGCDIWEEAESTLQKEALTLALGKAGLRAEELRYLFAGDLLGQSMATSFGLQSFEIPLFGLYGACSTRRGITGVSGNDGGSRLCRCGGCRYFQPFCQCGEAVSLSPGVCQSKALMYYLDGYGSRSLFTWQRIR